MSRKRFFSLERKVEISSAIVLASLAGVILLSYRGLTHAKEGALGQAAILGGAVFAFVVIGFAAAAIRRDVIARRLAETQLDRFFSLSLDFLCIASGDGYFKRVSPAVTDILGWSVEEFLASPFIDFVHPDDHAATLLEVEKQMVRGEKVLQFENRYRHKDGSWRVLSWRSMPQPDGLMYATARDVTELKRVESALREGNEQLEEHVQQRTAELAYANEALFERERRFRALIEHSGDSISLIDANNKILYLSPAVTSVEGYTPQELLGRSGIDDTHPDDIAFVQKTIQQLLANPGKPVPALWRRRHKNGHWIWLEGVATNLLHDPAVQGIVTNYRDVTERKQAESKLQEQLARLAQLSHITRAIGEHQDIFSIFQVAVRTLEEQMPADFACICLYDAALHRLTVCSIGVRSESLAMELAMTERTQIEIDGNGLSQCINGRLVYEADITEVPFPFPQRLQRVGLHSLVAAPLSGEDKVFGVLIVARLQANSFSSGDCEFLRQLSEHIALAAHHAQLYESVQTAYAELAQTQQAVMQQERLRVLGQMASGIAHDINNAISPVTLYTESLLESEPNLSSRARSYLQTIHQAIGDVAETVTRMREFYRQREPQLPSRKVQLNDLAVQVIDLTRARWADMPQQRGIVIDFKPELATDLPVILGVESEIREALTNLIFNAVEAMPKGGTLTLRTSASDNTNRKSPDSAVRDVCIEVIDSGMGMDEDTQRRCLELFFTTKGERGTGLGLAMVYGMARRHNAELEIESAVGKGTCMRLRFGAAPDDTTTPAISAERRATKNLRILIVDDDPVLLKSLRDTLEEDGHAITTANGGQEGIDLFVASSKQQPFDVVITDLGMPFIDGRKVASEVKAVSPATPVVMLTGWGQRLISDGEKPPHVDQVLSKPPRLRELRSALGSFFG